MVIEASVIGIQASVSVFLLSMGQRVRKVRFLCTSTTILIAYSFIVLQFLTNILSILLLCHATTITTLLVGCPNDCSGHGVCMSMNELSRARAFENSRRIKFIYGSIEVYTVYMGLFGADYK